MIQVYTVFVQKEEISNIHKQPYNLINIAGYVTLEKTDYEHANELVYYLLEDLDYDEIQNYQNNIIVVGVNEIEGYNKKIIKK